MYYKSIKINKKYKIILTIMRRVCVILARAHFVVFPTFTYMYLYRICRNVHNSTNREEPENKWLAILPQSRNDKSYNVRIALYYTYRDCCRCIIHYHMYE